MVWSLPTVEHVAHFVPVAIGADFGFVEPDVDCGDKVVELCWKTN